MSAIGTHIIPLALMKPMRAYVIRNAAGHINNVQNLPVSHVRPVYPALH